MKVAFISRATLYSAPGGDTKQLEQTALGLKEKGVDVDIYLSVDSIEYSKYDLLHFFNIIRPADIICHVKWSKKPYVVSTIFVEYNNITEEVRTPVSMVKSLVSYNMLEYFKVIARALKNGEKIMSKEYLLWGHKRSVKWVAQNAACLLPNSRSEYDRFVKRYGVTNNFVVVPNGINVSVVSKHYPSDEKYKNAILCMARIEPVKNQLNLIRALNNTQFNLYIHGKPSPNNVAYYEQCKKEAAGNVHILDWLQDDELYTAYSNAKVHVLPSYFETTGLSSLEAAVMGCNIVVTDRGDTKDYFGDNAWYCDPDGVGSIREAIEKAYAAPYDPAFKEHILRHFTWDEAAVQTLKAYNQILK